MKRNAWYLLIGLAVCLAAGVVVWQWLPTDAQPSSVAAVPEQGPLNQVRLTDEKIASLPITIQPVTSGSLQQTITLPGRLAYDAEKHVAVKSACEGIVLELRVRPGERVEQGQIVAVVSSPQVAAARAEVRSALGTLALAKQQRQWHQDVCAGVEELVALVRQGKSPEEIEQSVQGEALGTYREKLVSAYTRNLLATKFAESSRTAAEQGAIPGRLQQQREAERQAAEAAIASIAEQSLYEVQLGCQQSAAKLAEAERSVQVSLQRLNTLLGPAAKPATIDDLAQRDESALANVDLVSPITGTVEERLLATMERVEVQTPVYTIADNSSLWAIADVRQNDWAVMAAPLGTTVHITVPALEGVSLVGRVQTIGRTVDPATGAAQLVAPLESGDPRLRPGLFVRVTVPVGDKVEGMLVPEQAIVVHEDQPFVFVAEDDQTFIRKDVTTGLTVSGMTHILSGLAEGERVASSGVFKLKSELLLAGEEE